MMLRRNQARIKKNRQPSPLNGKVVKAAFEGTVSS
jgi:hypothetical protein